ncbi:M28 family metallopeptidase [Ekhidna sp.]|uniref:M28 family metallopeptidase n=1 Tax=Ekhidna sp. TaxID=2608089 RepID=UPI003C7CD1A6
MKLKLLLLISICTFSQIHGQNASLVKEQQLFIGMLSGKYQTPGGEYILARGSAEEREMAKELLVNQIADIGLEPKVHSYRMPNLNPLIDILFYPFKGANVYTVLPSTTESDEYVVLGAHYDSEVECPGAIDNATGSALVFSVVKHLRSMEYRSKNVLLVFFDQEEEELIGSKAFAKFLKNQKWNVHSVHTFDMVGWDGDGNKEMELELPTPYLEEVYKNKAEDMGIPIYVTSINSTDHHSFRQVGYPAIGVNEAYGKRDTSPFKDTPQDTFETVNFDYLAGSTLYVLEVMKEILK